MRWPHHGDELLRHLDIGIVADREQMRDVSDLIGWLGESLAELMPAGSAPEETANGASPAATAGPTSTTASDGTASE